MKLPVIKSLVEFIDLNDEDFVLEAIEVLEHLSQIESLTDEEMNIIGELLSNMFGAVEVQKAIDKGQSQRDALNGFMKRVMGSIDR